MSSRSIVDRLSLRRILGLVRGMFDVEYRRRFRIHEEIQRLKRLPRYQPATTDILGCPVELPDAASFAEMYYEIFERQMFDFPCAHDAPRVIDGGANIGLVVLYLKRRFPCARILAFEPDPQVFHVLERNVRTWACAGVELRQCALAAEEKAVQFMSEGSHSGRLARPGDSRDGMVPCVRLRPFLEEPVDFLKLNIEGAETEVLVDCADLLGNVGYVFVEYHSFAGERQTLPELLTVLRNAGFRLHINPVRHPLSQPLLESDVVLGMDLQLAIFGHRAT